eukprot:IDg15103t1
MEYYSLCSLRSLRDKPSQENMKHRVRLQDFSHAMVEHDQSLMILSVSLGKLKSESGIPSGLIAATIAIVILVMPLQATMNIDADDLVYVEILISTRELLLR